jgi:hypothetical protein
MAGRNSANAMNRTMNGETKRAFFISFDLLWFNSRSHYKPFHGNVKDAKNIFTFFLITS